MLSKRIVPCLDVRNKVVTKGVKFQNNVELGDPIEMAVAYSDGGCDELVFYDITASAERRPIDIEMVREVAKAVHIPFSVGGGIETIERLLQFNLLRLELFGEIHDRAHAHRRSYDCDNPIALCGLDPLGNLYLALSCEQGDLTHFS